MRNNWSLSSSSLWIKLGISSYLPQPVQIPPPLYLSYWFFPLFNYPPYIWPFPSLHTPPPIFVFVHFFSFIPFIVVITGKWIDALGVRGGVSISVSIINRTVEFFCVKKIPTKKRSQQNNARNVRSNFPSLWIKSCEVRSRTLLYIPETIASV